MSLRLFRCAVVDMSSRFPPGVGTILLRDSWSDSYEVTPSLAGRITPPLVANLHSRHTPNYRPAGKEISQTSNDVTRTLPTNPSLEAQGNAGTSLIAVKKVLTCDTRSCITSELADWRPVMPGA